MASLSLPGVPTNKPFTLAPFIFPFSFVLAAVAFPILGNDFLAAHHLLVDPAQPALIHWPSGCLLPLASPSSSPSPFLQSLPDLTPPLQDLLQAFPTVFSSDLKNLSPHHGVQHHIHSNGPPVFSKARHLDPSRLQQAKAEFDKLEAAGIIRCSNSPWSSPLHLVPKPDGSWQPCGDFRRLNLATTPDCCPLPNIQDLSARLHGATIFSKLDLAKVYHQVPVHPPDIPKMAVITPFGLCKYCYMPNGLCNAAQTFQRLLDNNLHNLPFAFVYLDDILNASSSFSQHLRHLHQLLSLLAANGILVNPAKCSFTQSSVDFLGHHVTAAGITPLSSHVQAILDYPQPTTVKDLLRFLGLINLDRCFVPHAAAILRPLTDALIGTPKFLPGLLP